MNEQPIEPGIAHKTDGHVLDVIDIFYTIQGEGPLVGFPAIFIRLAGCNLNCPLCDTDYTNGRRNMPLTELLNIVAMLQRSCPAGVAVITGGEPTRQNIEPLCRDLFNMGFMVQIESNGVLPLPGALLDEVLLGSVMWVVSPKTSRVDPSTRDATAFKYVIRDGAIDFEDGLPTTALGHTARPRVARPPQGYEGQIIVTPCDDKSEIANQLNRDAARDSALAHGYVLGIQMHKLFNVA